MADSPGKSHCRDERHSSGTACNCTTPVLWLRRDSDYKTLIKLQLKLASIVHLFLSAPRCDPVSYRHIQSSYQLCASHWLCFMQGIYHMYHSDKRRQAKTPENGNVDTSIFSERIQGLQAPGHQIPVPSAADKCVQRIREPNNPARQAGAALTIGTLGASLEIYPWVRFWYFPHRCSKQPPRNVYKFSTVSDFIFLTSEFV